MCPDYINAFDKHESDIHRTDIRIITNIYWWQKAKIILDGNEADAIEIKREVRQGCIFPPLEDIRQGITINGEIVKNIIYSDDTILIADSLEELQELVNRVTKNMVKILTKYMLITKTTI